MCANYFSPSYKTHLWRSWLGFSLLLKLENTLLALESKEDPLK